MRDHLSVSSSYSALLDIISTSSGGIKLSTITDLKNILSDDNQAIRVQVITNNKLVMCQKCISYFLM